MLCTSKVILMNNLLTLKAIKQGNFDVKKSPKPDETLIRFMLLKHTVLAFTSAMHLEAPLKSYQTAKQNSSKIKIIQRSIAIQWKSIIKHYHIFYLTMSIIDEKNGKNAKSTVSDESGRHMQVRTQAVTYKHNMQLVCMKFNIYERTGNMKLLRGKGMMKVNKVHEQG